jgi:hypothetical protein
VPTLLQASPPRDRYQYFFEKTLGDFTEELEIARKQVKQAVFLFFEMDECPCWLNSRQSVSYRQVCR